MPGGALHGVAWRVVASLRRAVALSMPLHAHHSAVMFDASRSIQVKGTVKQFLWANPHCLLVLTVNEDGNFVDYSFEGNGPGYLVHFGWKRGSVKVGDVITVISHPLYDGRKGGDLVEVVTASGRTLFARSKPSTPGSPRQGGSS